ncbi:5951_t:CDS:2, partial [Scutellospora calospora]
NSREEPKNLLLQSHKEALEVYVIDLAKELLELKSEKEKVITTREEQERLYNEEFQAKNERRNKDLAEVTDEDEIDWSLSSTNPNDMDEGILSDNENSYKFKT